MEAVAQRRYFVGRDRSHIIREGAWQGHDGTFVHGLCGAWQGFSHEIFQAPPNVPPLCRTCMNLAERGTH